jgi:hypothetical protein
MPSCHPRMVILVLALTGAVVRRWLAPSDGTVTVSGIMGHRSDQGDGIRATFAIGDRVMWQEVQKNNNRPYGPETWPIKKGQTLDVIADDNGTTAYDGFFWRANVQFAGSDGRVVESNSFEDFSGPITEEQSGQANVAPRAISPALIAQQRILRLSIKTSTRNRFWKRINYESSKTTVQCD